MEIQVDLTRKKNEYSMQHALTVKSHGILQINPLNVMEKSGKFGRPDSVQPTVLLTQVGP